MARVRPAWILWPGEQAVEVWVLSQPEPTQTLKIGDQLDGLEVPCCIPVTTQALAARRVIHPRLTTRWTSSLSGERAIARSNLPAEERAIVDASPADCQQAPG